MFKIIIFSIISFPLTYLFIKLLMPVLKKRLLDNPNHRSSHTLPIPKGGGIAFVVIGSLFCIFGGSNYVLFLLPLAFLGLFDDKYNLPRNLRYLFQFSTSLLFIIKSDLLFESLLNLNFIFLVLIYFIFIVMATGIINFVNFMDGVDGIVAGCMIILISYSSLYIDINLLFIAFSLIAFLIWNWSPAKLFMGDTGSLFLGGLFVSILSKASSWELLMSLFIIATPLILDPLLCLYKRFESKKNIFNPHREHLYQRMNQHGLSHSLVSSIYIAMTFSLAIIHYIGGIKLLFFGLLLEIIIGFYANKFYAVAYK